MRRGKKTIESSLDSLIEEEIIVGRKYYSIESIKNFLYHFDEIKDYNLQEYIIENVAEYIKEIKQNPINNMIDGKALYQEYIYPVGKIYESMCSFMPFVHKITLFYLGCISFIFGYLINLKYIWGTFTIIILTAYYIYITIKKKQKRVYGLSC